mmetsp:Transcript_71438/g.143818  ORF Transcript_71438/g.143818 Transcript_71438/m.143818 type:complete len:82 (-) Transcript_71438:310-555(-)
MFASLFVLRQIRCPNLPWSPKYITHRSEELNHRNFSVLLRPTKLTLQMAAFASHLMFAILRLGKEKYGLGCSEVGFAENTT